MKLKKVNKAFGIYNCRIDIYELSNKVNYKVLPKRGRTQLNNVHYYNWSCRWFPYKNFELSCYTGYISFVLI